MRRRVRMTEFTLLQEFPFGEADLKYVRLIGSTGGAKYSLDAVVTDLRIRAESLPDLPAPADTAAAAPTPAESKSLVGGHSSPRFGGSS